MGADLTQLRPRFDDVWTRGVGTGRAERAWDRLNAGYGDPARAYHGWDHIAAMLAGLDAVRREPEFADARLHEVELAVFFHDAVYDPRRHDNEAASAALFSEEAGTAAIGEEGVRRVCDLILATAEHRTSPDAATRLLIDLDLAILGAEPEAYDDYAAAIRREYAHVDEVLWRLGRGTVVKRFLERGRIFQSAVFESRLGGRALANLGRESKSLEA